MYKGEYKMFQNQSVKMLHKIFSAVLALSLAFPAPGYTTDVVATRNSGASLDLLETTLGAGTLAMSEIRDFDASKFIAEEARLRKLTTWSIFNVSLNDLLGGIPALPEPMRAAAEKALREANTRGQFKGLLGDFRVFRVGESLHFHLAHKAGEKNPAIVRMIRDSVFAAIEEAHNSNLLDTKAYKEFVALSADAKIAALTVSPVELSRTKRGSDPQVVAVYQNIDLPFLNRVIRKLIGGDAEGFQSLNSIEGIKGFRVRLRHVEDIRTGNENGNVLELDTSTDVEALTNVLMSQEWVPFEIYPLPGGRANSDEPAVRISIDNVFADGKYRPRQVVVYVASQSGLWGVGEIARILTDVTMGAGGKDGGQTVVLTPVTLEDSVERPAQSGFARVTLYGFQAAETVDGKGNPRMPKIMDYTKQTPEVYRLKHDTARKLHEFVQRHRGFPIAITDQHAREQAEKTAERLAKLFKAIPKLQQDPLRDAANAKARYTRSLFKADVGGELGHTVPPWLYYLVGRAAAKAGVDIGLFTDAKIIHKQVPDGWLPNGTDFPGGVGDDIQFVATHEKGLNSMEVHSFFMRTFLMMGVVMKWVGEDPYGWLQDIVSPELTAEISTNGKLDLRKLEAKAGVNTPEGQRIVAGLLADLQIGKKKKVLDLEQVKYLKIIADANAAAVKPLKGPQARDIGEAKPFSNNVQGMGPGWAEVLTDDPSAEFATHHTDKDGPAFFNIPTLKAAEQAFESGVFPHGVVFEIYDTIAHRRIFLDLETQKPEIYSLLGDLHRYNIKKLYAKTVRKWSPKASESEAELLKYVNPVHFFEASTEKLAIITGGEYRGKDDAVSITNNKRFNDIFKLEVLKYATQGDARGSFVAIPRPSPLGEAVATDNSRPIQVNLEHKTDSKGRMVVMRDVYASPEFKTVQAEIEEMNNLLWKAQGLFAPIGPTPDKVEPTYPVIATFIKITGEMPTTLLQGKSLGHAHGEKSKFKKPYHSNWNSVLRQADMVDRFPGLAHRLSPEAAALVANADQPKTILVHPDLLKSPDFEATVRKLQIRLGGEGLGAVKFQVMAKPRDPAASLEIARKEAGNVAHIDAVIAPANVAKSLKGRFVKALVTYEKPRSRKEAVSFSAVLNTAVEALAHPGETLKKLPVAKSGTRLTLTNNDLARSEVRLAATPVKVDLSDVVLPEISQDQRLAVFAKYGLKVGEAILFDESFVEWGGLAFVATYYQGPVVVISQDPVIRATVEAFKAKFGVEALELAGTPEQALELAQDLAATAGLTDRRALVTEDVDGTVKAALIRALSDSQVSKFWRTRFDQMAADAGLSAVVASLVNAILTARSA